MTQLVGVLIGGLMLGATYTLIALGLVVAFRATGTFNFAHGSVLTLCAFVAGTLQSDHDMPFLAAAAISLVVAGLLGAGMYVAVLRKTVGFSHFVGIIATLGLAAIIDALLTLFFGTNNYTLRAPALPSGTWVIGGFHGSKEAIVVAVLSLLLAAVVAGVLRYSHIGTKVRASGLDPILASQSGIDVRRLHTLSWTTAGVLAGIAGIAYGTANSVDLSMSTLSLAAFPAMLLGGMDSAEGAIIGGTAIGILQTAVATYFGGEYTDMVTYSVLLVVLLVMPSGLLGARTVARV